jgi:hypothetical protein
LIFLYFTMAMAKGTRSVDETKGELLFTETIPKKLQPRKVLAGKRWGILENLGRVAEVVLLVFLIDLIASTDLSVASNVVNILFCAVALVLMIYVTEVISPRGRRMSYPVKVWSKGVEVHTSFLEEVRGFPGFIPKESIKALIVRRIDVNIDGKVENMPTTLKLRLSNGKVLDLGRRNYHELDKMVRQIKERYGVEEDQPLRS